MYPSSSLVMESPPLLIRSKRAAIDQTLCVHYSVLGHSQQPSTHEVFVQPMTTFQLGQNGDGEECIYYYYVKLTPVEDFG